jgi:Mce-associated membrane protein
MSTITTPAGRAVEADEGVSHPDPLAADTDHLTTDRPDRRPVGPDRAAERARALRLTPRLLWVVVAVALVASLALGATRGRDWYAARQTAAANASAVAAAKQLAINFVTVDYTKVDADVARVKAGATGEFLKSYSTSAADLSRVLVANKTVSTVQRTEAALVSGDQDSAVALVGVVAPTKNTAVPNGETKTYRMRLDLRMVGDAWKVENLEFVG